jgi:hypothetical protein
MTQFENTFGTGHGIGHLLALPWDLTMHAAAFGGSFGVLFLLLVPLAMRLRPRRLPLLAAVFCVGYVVLWFSPVSSLQARFLVPLAAAAAPFAGAGLERVVRAAAAMNRLTAAVPVALAAGVALLSLPPFITKHERDRHGDLGWLTNVVRETPMAYLTGAESYDAYLRRVLPGYGADRFVAEHARPRDRVMAFADMDEIYTGAAEVVPDYAICLERARADRGDDAQALGALRADRVRYIMWDVERRGEQPDLAVTDPAFERRHLRLVYADDNRLLFRVAARQ